MLRQTQHAFLASICQPQDNQFVQYIRFNHQTPPETQLAIYRNSITARFQKALLAIYPVCHQLVGTEFFTAMATAFIETSTSHSPDLNNYGSEFADFISDFPPAQSLSYLADTARLEWAWHWITGAPDDASFDYQGLATCYENQGDRIIFTLPTRATLLASPYPLHHIWESNQKNYSGDAVITLDDQQHYHFLIWRDQTELRIDTLTQPQWFILNLLYHHTSLLEVCEQTALTHPEIDVPTLLSTWVANGWIAGFKI